MPTRKILAAAALLLVGALFGWLANAGWQIAGVQAQDKHPATKPKYATDIPPAVTTPNAIETRLGTLKFTDGFPDDATVTKVYDNLDFQRGVQAFLTAMPAASLSAMRKGIRSFGPENQTLIIFETLMDSRSLFLTANTESIYTTAWLDLKKGPVVVESPPNTLGIVDDFWFRYVADLGNAGPDKGKGGKFLFLPPGYNGEVPKEGYFVYKSPTYGNWFITRGFLEKGDPKPGVASIKKHLRIYPLAQAEKPPETKFVNVSGKAFNTTHAMDFSYWEEVNQVVQEEPRGAIDPETLGLLASIGIEKGKKFVPDDRMKKILTEAAAVGQATARALTYRSRLKEAKLFPDSAWQSAFVGGSYEFLHDGARLLDARSFFFYATGITPAMAAKNGGVGSQYAVAFVDSKGRPLDGGKTYKLHLPPNIPAKNFWSVVLYDNQTRSMLQTDVPFPSLSSQKKGIVVNEDKSVDVYFGPKAPAGKESNWVQTVPGKGWNTILRLYGPLEPWFDKTWRPGEIEEVK
jgi:hypothetical protein